MDFCFDLEYLSTIPLWVKFLGLPVGYWSSEDLRELASGVGKPLYTDKFTAKEKILYTRVLVKEDISQPLPEYIETDTPEKKLLAEIDKWSNIEEQALRQKSRASWIICGDTNSKSQSNDNSESDYEEASKILDQFGSQNFTAMLQEASMPCRYVNDQYLELNFTLSTSYVPPKENNAISNEASVPPVESPATNNSRASYARGRMPRPDHSPSRTRREVHVKQEHRQRDTDCPRAIRPISNGLYDPSYAAKGEPVDPHLRMLKQNPNFCNPKVGQDKVMINLNE
uniref:Uncharacterized protein LOC104240718 n=1 Tax=Nicotiana sylvestris TaxID=4096 RepID=A0A1U7Y525_NICSY|nr:PREDICTED: uncharacterized protein LOC104240718 [Nicotiana sylvestris]